MKEIVDVKKCSGCTACMNVCHKKAIHMKVNRRGFKYPVINQEKCIDCGLCRKTCPVLHNNNIKSMNECYVGYNLDEKSKLNKASSGSIFELVANYVFENNGIIIGAAFDQDNKLKHIAVDKKKDLESLKGSKYLQSDLDNIFTYIKEQLKEHKVLFVGTPCQVAGLKSFIKNDFNNLICIDVVCHGVPSPKLFDKYIKELEKNNNKKVKEYNFRDKSTGWDTYSNTITFDNNEKKSQLQCDNDYMKLFLSDIALRESCYNCKFKLGNKYSDITLGDFWGVKKYYPDMYDKKGVSAIIVNTEKGKEVFNTIKGNIKYKECKLEEIVEGNPSLKNSSTKPLKRDEFFKDLNNKPIEFLTKKYVKKISFKQRIKNRIKKYLKCAK